MPRAEDIAWKFVIRLEGKKWRCSYCKNEYSGSVTRVKNHILKQPREGVVPCTKVPEPISTLMELLLNQVRNKEDIPWKFIDSLGENKWRCHHCREEFFGDLTGVKGHLLGVPNEGISICTGVPEHVRTLMRSLLDEVAEEESRGANGQSSTEPQSRHMPAQAEVPEEESREANSQFFTERQQSSLPAEIFSPTLEQWVQSIIITDIGVNSDQLSQPERQFHQSSTMPLLVQSSHGESSNGQSSTEPQSRHMPAQAEVPEEESREANSQFFTERQQSSLPAEIFSPTLEQWVQSIIITDIGVNSDQLSQPERQFHQSSTMPLLVQSSHGESSNGQSSTEPQSRHMPAQAEVPEEESREANSQFFTERQQSSLPAEIFSPTLEQWVQSIIITDIGVNSDQLSQPERQFHQSSTMPLLVQSSHGESSMIASMEEGPNPLNLLYQPQCSIQSQMQMNDQQTPTGASSFQYDQVPAVGNSNCLQDSNWLSQLQTPMDIGPSIASQHTIDSRVPETIMVDSPDPEAATNTTGPSSSQDVNRSSAIMDVRSNYANDKDIRNLKRKVGELEDKEAVTKEQIEIESAASSVRTKPRILVERQATAETLPSKEQVETLTRDVEELIGNSLPQTQIEERDAKGVKFWERKLTGEVIHRHIELIWDCLKKNHEYKLGIYGMGGVGKTTIMMHIHNRLLDDVTFDGVFFITVSKDCSIYKLQRDIYKALKLDFMKDEHENKRAAMLSKQLERKKNCVLILDDVWERLDLEEVGIPVRADGFKLVVTTRSVDVCCQMHCQKKIKIQPLSQEEAESLFLEELGSKAALNLEIEAIMKSIVKECEGLPLGVIMMARSMREVTEVFKWRDSLAKLEEYSKGQTVMETKVLMNLKFSYDHLDNPNVQQCFLSCALYPEGKLIGKFELVEFFIDQGLIGGLNTRKEQYDRGLSILHELGNVCLLEDHGVEIKMHDLIRDMALYTMSATSGVIIGKGLTMMPPEDSWTDALEKVFLMENDIREFPLNLSPNCPKLSILLLNGSLRVDVVIPDSFFGQLRELKVLNLSECNLSELPDSISGLENLRALLLRNCTYLHRIPYLGKLKSLTKLDVSCCRSLEALEGLEKLVNLRYLDLFYTGISILPKGILDRLLYLQYLNVERVNDGITKLRALETLECNLTNADDVRKFVRLIGESNKPRYYHLDIYKSWSEVRMWHHDLYGNLKRGVKIRFVSHAIMSVGGECTGISVLIPRNVQVMDVRNCNGATNLPDMGPLKYLEELTIQKWEDLAVLYGGQDEEVIDIHDFTAPPPTHLLFPSLRVLEIYECSKLKYLFGHGSNLPQLQKIYVSNCNEMVGIIAAVTSPPPHPLPTFPSLEEIYIYRCHKMTRVVESEWLPHFLNLRNIRVNGCENLKEIIRGPPPYVPVLEFLDVVDCGNMTKLFPHDWLLHLQNLQKIKVCGCRGMVEMISGPGQSQEGSIMTPVNNTPSSFLPSSISLPKLKYLYLRDLPQLKSICKVPISCNSMKVLNVYKCPELKGIPLQLQLCDIEDLPYIWVEDEEKWKMLMWNHPNAQAILQPYLQKGEHATIESYYSWIRQCSPNAIGYELIYV